MLDAKISPEDVGQLYDRIAPFYDLWARLTESNASFRAIQLAEVEDGVDILEVAVGTGRTFYQVAERNPSGTNQGIDISNGMLS